MTSVKKKNYEKKRGKRKFNSCFGCVLFRVIYVACLWMCVSFDSSFVCLHVHTYDFMSKVHCGSALQGLLWKCFHLPPHFYTLKHVACVWMFLVFVCLYVYAYDVKSKVYYGSALGRAGLFQAILLLHTSCMRS